MEFELSDEQRMLEGLIRDLLDSDGRNRPASGAEPGWNRRLWRELGIVGVLAAPLPEEFGGMPGGAVSSMLIMQAMGANLARVPFVPTIVCAARLIACFGTEKQRSIWLPPILRGESICALANAETRHDTASSNVATLARREGDHYILNGTKSFVVGASSADHLLVLANVVESEEIGAFWIRCDEAGVTLHTQETIDGASASEVTLEEVQVSTDACIGAQGYIDREDLNAMEDAATVALCAEAVGSMQALLEATVAYCKQRKQFGRAIGGFQALQHRMVDMLVARDQATAMVHQASLCLGLARKERVRATSACKVTVGRLGRLISQAAVQLHGGIGITEELDVTHHFRRIEIFNLRFGTLDDHLERYIGLLDA